MSPEKRIREIALQIAQSSQAQTTRLQNEFVDLEAKKIEIEAKLQTAKFALDRLSNFQISDGRDYFCPWCAVLNDTRSKFYSIPGPDGADPNSDFFRCQTCREILEVPS